MPRATPFHPAGPAPLSPLSGSSNASGNPRVRRGYFECRYGQLHVHNSIPSGGGFEEGTPLLCLHSIPHSGRVFVPFLAVFGAGRSVFAPDLPGFGNSDPPPSRAGVAEHAAAIGDFLDAMRLRQIDLLGHRFGALVAAELAATRPTQVKRLVMASPPYAAETGGPPPTASGATAAAAELAYPLRARLTPLAVPILVLRLGDEAAANKELARDLPARARLIDLPTRDASIFETAPEAAVQAVESFLR